MPHENFPAAPIDISYLREVPVEKYPHPFIFKIAESYLSVDDDPDRIYLTQQIPFVLDTLTPKELVEAGECIDALFPKIVNAEGERVRIWPEDAGRFNVDKYGNVQATVSGKLKSIGNKIQVITFLNEYFSPEKDTTEALEETLIMLIMEAVEEYKDNLGGFQVAIDVEKALRDETNRRLVLTRVPKTLHKINERLIAKSVWTSF